MKEFETYLYRLKRMDELIRTRFTGTPEEFAFCMGISERNLYDCLLFLKEISVAEETVMQAKENLKISEDSFKTGTVNVSDLLEAQALHQQAKNQLTEVKANYKNKIVNYFQVTGRY